MNDERKYINPYNFVPLGETSPERRCYPGLHRLDPNSYSGTLHCELTALQPIFTADQTKDLKKDGRGKVIRRYSFLTTGDGKGLIQGTSLRGMIRAVFETVTRSCLVLSSPQGVFEESDGTEKRYSYESLGEFDTAKCASLQRLCPACRLFGMVNAQGDDETSDHGASRVVFEDSVFTAQKLKAGPVTIPDQYGPRAYHHHIYSESKEANGPIAGRKFYYHHKALQSRRGTVLEEYLPSGANISFKVRLRGLEKGELSTLLWCLELGRDEDLAHKLGLARPLGLGSCRVRVADEESKIYKGSSRYLYWQNSSGQQVLKALRQMRSEVPRELYELLRLSKHEGQEEAVMYPPQEIYRRTEGVRISRDDGEILPVQEPAPLQAAAPVREPELPLPPSPIEGMKGVLREAFENQLKADTGAAEAPVAIGDRVQARVLSVDGLQVTVLIEETEQEFRFRASRYLRKGQEVRLRVERLDASGRVSRASLR